MKIGHEDIDYERSKSEEQDRREGNPIHEFPDAYLETLAVYRKIAEKLIYLQPKAARANLRIPGSGGIVGAILSRKAAIED